MRREFARYSDVHRDPFGGRIRFFEDRSMYTASTDMYSFAPAVTAGEAFVVASRGLVLLAGSAPVTPRTH